MKKNRGILYWLRVVLAVLLIGTMITRCVATSGFKAYAVEGSGGDGSSESVTLSLAQTLALYGTDLYGQYYDNRSREYKNITLHFVQSIKQIGYMDSGGGFGDYQTNQGQRYIPLEMAEYICGSNALIYAADSADWGGGSFPTTNSQANSASNDWNSALFNLKMNMSVPLSSVDSVRQYFAWSTGSDDYRYPVSQYPNLSPIDKLANWNGTFWKSVTQGGTVPDPYGKAVEGVTSGGVKKTANMTLPLYPYSSSDGSLYEEDTCLCSFWHCSTEVGTQFTLLGYQLGGQMWQPTPNGSLFFIVGCPTLTAYNGPEITTPDVTSTFPVATFLTETMPSTYTESPQQIIVNNQNTQINQLNLIIGQLNLIYAQLVANGKVSVDLGLSPDLQDGESVSFYGTDIHSEMQAIIDGHTTTISPEFNNSFVSAGYDFLTEESWIAWLGGLGLTLSVASWIIFKGRGSA